jgi:hypothetical protein
VGAIMKIKATGRKICAALTVSFLCAPSLFIEETAHAQIAKIGCDRMTVSMLLSPDNEWAAFVHQDICSDGFFVTVISNVVQIARRGEVSAKENDVLALDTAGNPEDRPLTQWLSAEKLQITIPNKSLIGLRKEKFQNIQVVIKFIPDDPPERQRWLKELGLSEN